MILETKHGKAAPRPAHLARVAAIVSAYVSGNPLPAGQVTDLIEAVSQALARAERGVGATRQEQAVEDKKVIIKRLRSEGVSLREIAQRVGLSTRQVSRIAGPKEGRSARLPDQRRAAAEKREMERAATIEYARRRIATEAITQDLAIALLNDAGMSLREIAAEHGRSHEWVRKRLRVARHNGAG